MLPLNSINKIAKLISDTVSFGVDLTVYKNKISVKEIETNIIETCFSGKSFSTSHKDKFLSIDYPKFYQRKSSSGLLSKSSIIHFERKNNIITVSFPINLLKREIISFETHDYNDRLEIIAYGSIEEISNKLQLELIHSSILTIKRHKIKIENNISIDDIKQQFKVVEIITH